MKRKLTAEEWYEVADIFGEAGSAAEMQIESNGKAASDYAAKRLNQLAMQATRKAASLAKASRNPTTAISGTSPESPRNQQSKP